MNRDAAEAVERMEAGCDAPWIERAYLALAFVCGMRSGGELTTDAVWAVLEQDDVPPPSEPKAMAAVMQRGQRAGWIEPTDSTKPSVRASNHGRPIRKWRVLKP